MKIAVIYLGRRGAGEKIALELARHLNGAHETFAFLSQHAENLDGWNGTAVKFHKFDTYQNMVGAFFSLIIPFKTQKIVERIRQIQPDILLFPMFHPWNALIQKTLCDIPSVVYVHDPRPHPDIPGWFYEKLENRSIHLATRCVVMSEALKPALVQRGVSSKIIDVAPLGPLSDTRTMPLRGRERDFPTLLFFGRIVRYKGLEILLDAYERVKKNILCRLVIVGEGNIQAYRKKLARSSNVKMVNRWVSGEEIGDFFLQSDVVVLPYTSASQSGVIPIAAAFGLPVIATLTGGLSEQIEDGISGWLVPAGDAVALADAISEALLNIEESRQRGRALKERYEKLLSWAQHTRQMEQSLLKAQQAQGRK
ncbi:MAG: glycosyltransferase family 4 protein [Chloroflexi bacterium]|nr:glycosyltransferase family 4 protein [Chloroflexota bacterium]